MQLLPAALPPAAYLDRDWFEKEKTLLFTRLWQFFTLSGLVDKPNKFVTKKLFGVPIVVQNFGGELRAFENTCLHRQAPIQTEAFGCRPLTCGYHGWNYSADGKVAAIPFEKEYYLFSDEDKEKLCLRTFALKKIGNLIFINLSPDPIPLERQFSRDFISSLINASEAFDNEILMTTFRRRFNWKLIFENLRDGLHPSFLHKDTLYKSVKFRPAVPQEDALNSYFAEREAFDPSLDPFDEVRKWFSKGGPDGRIENAPSYPWHAHVHRFGNDDCYYNWLVFPNLHMASGTGGYSFIIEHYVPQGPDVTDVEVYYVTAKRKKPYLSSKAVLFEHLVGAEAVLSEDFLMLEKVQDNLRATSPPAAWGAFELRSHRISTWLSRVINDQITF